MYEFFSLNKLLKFSNIFTIIHYIGPSVDVYSTQVQPTQLPGPERPKQDGWPVSGGPLPP